MSKPDENLNKIRDSFGPVRIPPRLPTSAWADTLFLMLTEGAAAKYQWLRAGNEAFPAMLAAIDAAQRSVCLETYTFAAGTLGERFRDALVRARERGARVR